MRRQTRLFVQRVPSRSRLKVARGTAPPRTLPRRSFLVSRPLLFAESDWSARCRRTGSERCSTRAPPGVEFARCNLEYARQFTKSSRHEDRATDIGSCVAVGRKNKITPRPSRGAAQLQSRNHEIGDRNRKMRVSRLLVLRQTLICG